MRKTFEMLIVKYQGDGPYLIIDGNKYIDAASETFNLSLGYTNKR